MVIDVCGGGATPIVYLLTVTRETFRALFICEMTDNSSYMYSHVYSRHLPLVNNEHI